MNSVYNVLLNCYCLVCYLLRRVQLAVWILWLKFTSIKIQCSAIQGRGSWLSPWWRCPVICLWATDGWYLLGHSATVDLVLLVMYPIVTGFISELYDWGSH